MLTDEQLKKFHEFFEQKLKPALEENRDEILKLLEYNDIADENE